MQINGWLLCGRLPSFIALSVKFCTSSHFPLRAFSLFYIFPFGRIFTPVCHFVYITLFRHFVYAILFKSLRLLRLHLMQASALPSLVASITFGYYLDSGSTRAADNSVYAWHIYMFSPCFPLNFVLPHIFPFVRFPFFTFSPSGVYLRPFVTLFTSLCLHHFVPSLCLSHFVYCACI